MIVRIFLTTKRVIFFCFPTFSHGFHGFKIDSLAMLLLLLKTKHREELGAITKNYSLICAINLRNNRSSPIHPFLFIRKSYIF